MTQSVSSRDGNKKTPWLKVFLIALLLVGALVAYVGWYKVFRDVPQPDWIRSDPQMRFKYGSIGSEYDAGIPFWIYMVLPQMFPEYLPGNGGYTSLGLPWEEGQVLPIGFTRKTIGFDRVGNNCAMCHTTQYRVSEETSPVYVIAGAGHTVDIEGMFTFLIRSAKDPRFNADNILEQIGMIHDLPFIDKLLYRFAIIPITKKRLLEREEQFAWMFREDFPDWGRGRDDPMNLTKYFMLNTPMDDSYGPADIPSIWNLQKYDPELLSLNWDGATHDVHSVVIDSALGIMGAEPHDKREFLEEVAWLQDYLRTLPPPKWPFAIDGALAEEGKTIFDQQCAGCHASEQTGKPMPLAMVGTSPARRYTWNRQNAIDANRIVSDAGIERAGLVEEELPGYVAQFLDGLWLRGPYLHNGSVPTIRDLLLPADQRPVSFYRGYDVYDQQNIGFVSQGSKAQRYGTLLDTRVKGNSNQGHEFGTQLMAADKAALMEYLKTL
ncbi:hypothetical protein DXV75_12945 [Alteromonas aestuariivivens]|uniref:Cytochrome c domain-containing protein n=1 Tax=Alteromonas aestuariivivens TaxID=1938339 RepID=A0A3D8M4V0_9ALTE|nr:c-type cytochrome [Alteromonas aestuariivivens]RDV24600.1 hypothetical protein DXV75_12945 [Alteromonas aestuariivivens]